MACISHPSVVALPPDEQSLVARSLRSSAAKAWINDSDWEGIDGIHIEYEPWIAKARAASTGTLAEQQARFNAWTGVLAPKGNRIEIKGAWVMPSGDEWLDPNKACRSESIRDYGCF
jgi:hypothetical protein